MNNYQTHDLFRRRANRFCAYFIGYGWVPVATRDDDYPVFVTKKPEKVGDDTVIYVEGKRRLVRLLRCGEESEGPMFLVDLGPYPREM